MSQSKPKLTPDEVAIAREQQCVDATHDYPKLERVYNDPLHENQRYALISFAPAAGATPDADGLYGLFKVRGVFQTRDESDARADWLIENIDSYHPILTVFNGRWHPFLDTTSDKYKQSNHDRSRVHMDRDKLHNEIRSDLERRVKQERNAVQDVKDREKALLDEQNTPEALEDKYTMLQTKRSQLIYTYSSGLERLQEVQNIVINTIRQIKALNDEHPELKSQYLERYYKAQDAVGMTRERLNKTFVKYLSGDSRDLFKYKVSLDECTDEEMRARYESLGFQENDIVGAPVLDDAADAADTAAVAESTPTTSHVHDTE